MLRKPEVYLWQQVSKLFIYVPWYRVVVVALVIKFMLLNFSLFFALVHYGIFFYFFLLNTRHPEVFSFARLLILYLSLK